MDHASLRYLKGEAAALDLEAARIDQGIAMGVPLDSLAARCIARASDRVGPLLSEEQATLTAVLLEHDPSEPTLKREIAAREKVRDDCIAIEEAMRSGENLAPRLETYAADLHRYADIEREDVARVAQAAGDRVLREADYRVRNYGRQDPAVPVGEGFWSARP